MMFFHRRSVDSHKSVTEIEPAAAVVAVAVAAVVAAVACPARLACVCGGVLL